MELLTEYESKLTAYLDVPENKTAVYNHQVYDSKFVRLLRDVNKKLKIYKNPVSDDHLTRLGLSLESILTIDSGFNAPVQLIRHRFRPVWYPSVGGIYPISSNITLYIPVAEQLWTRDKYIKGVSEDIKRLCPKTFAKVATLLIAEKVWESVDVPVIIVHHAECHPESGEIYADLISNVQRAEWRVSGTTNFSKIVAAIVKKRFVHAAYRYFFSRHLRYLKKSVGLTSFISQLYRLKFIENSVLESILLDNIFFALGVDVIKKLNTNDIESIHTQSGSLQG